MTRKPLLITGIILEVLVFWVVLVWPAAPLWKRLGVKTYCIQHEGSRLHLTPCSESTELTAMIVKRPLPMVSVEGPIPLIVDDDGTAHIWDPISGEKLIVFKGHTDIVAGVTFSPDGKYCSRPVSLAVPAWRRFPVPRSYAALPVIPVERSALLSHRMA